MATYDKQGGDQTVTDKTGKIITNIGAGKSKVPSSKATSSADVIPLTSENLVSEKDNSLTPEQAFEKFKKAKDTIRETELKAQADKEFIESEKKRIQNEILEKLLDDRIIVREFLNQAYEEKSISEDIFWGNKGVTDVAIDKIVEPSSYLENKNDDDEDALYEEGHEPLIYLTKSDEPRVVAGFLKGDDQNRITGSRKIQERFESWVAPQYRGLKLEVKAINTAIEKKIKASNESAFDFHTGTFEALVWEGNKQMAIDLIGEGWEPVLPKPDDAFDDEKQRFHLFTKTIEF